MSKWHAPIKAGFFNTGRIWHMKSQIISTFRSHPNSSFESLTSLHTKTALSKKTWSQATQERLQRLFPFGSNHNLLFPPRWGSASEVNKVICSWPSRSWQLAQKHWLVWLQHSSFKWFCVLSCSFSSAFLSTVKEWLRTAIEFIV